MIGQILNDLFPSSSSSFQEELRRREEQARKDEERRLQEQAQKEKQKAEEQKRKEEERKRKAEEAKKPMLAPQKGIGFGQHQASQGAGANTNAQPLPYATVSPSEASRGSGSPVVETPMASFQRTQPSNNVKLPPQMNLGPPNPPVFLPEEPSPWEQVAKALIGNRQNQDQAQNPLQRIFGQTKQGYDPLPTNSVRPGEFMPLPQGPMPGTQLSPMASAQQFASDLGASFQERLANLRSGAQQAYPNNPLMQQVAISQAILESGLQGKGSSLARKYNNLFGIKGSGTAGSVNLPTKEFMNGSMQSVNDAFARNSSIADSFSQHRNLMNKPRYKSVMSAVDPMGAFNALKQSGYATDPNYASKLYNIFNRYVRPMY